MAIPTEFQLPLLGPMGSEYAESVDMTTIIGLRPIPCVERPRTTSQNGSRDQAPNRE